VRISCWGRDYEEKGQRRKSGIDAGAWGERVGEKALNDQNTGGGKIELFE